MFGDNDFPVSESMEDIETWDAAPVAATCLLTAVGSCFYTLKITCEKINACTRVKFFESQHKNHTVLPISKYDVDFSKNKSDERSAYERVNKSIKWADIGCWATCSACFSGVTYVILSGNV